MPVIFLTSKDEEIDELFGLQDGRRRFHPQTVLAAPPGRAREGGAAPRGAEGPTAAAAKDDRCAKVLERGLLRMDPERHTCTWKSEPVTLTVTEFLILQALAAAPRRGEEPQRADGRRL